MQDSAPSGEQVDAQVHRQVDVRERDDERSSGPAPGELEQLRTEVEQLRAALARRPVIDMAKGAVMAVARCDEEAAFRQLSGVSQTHNVKLFDLASALLHDLPASAAEVPARERRPAPATLRDTSELVARNWTRI